MRGEDWSCGSVKIDRSLLWRYSEKSALFSSINSPSLIMSSSHVGSPSCKTPANEKHSRN